MHQPDLFDPPEPEPTPAQAIFIEYLAAALLEPELPIDARLRRLAQLATVRGIEVVAYL